MGYAIAVLILVVVCILIQLRSYIVTCIKVELWNLKFYRKYRRGAWVKVRSSLHASVASYWCPRQNKVKSETILESEDWG